MVTKKTIIISSLILFVISFFVFPGIASATEIGKEFSGFTISPGVIEEWFNPGENKTKTIYIKNDLGRDTIFDIQVEDFESSTDPKIATTLLGDRDGAYSLKNHLKPSSKEVFIRDGETVSLKVQISIPKDTKMTGFYGALLVKPKSEVLDRPESTKVYPRLGTLFYIGIESNKSRKSEIIDFKYISAKDCKEDCNEEDPTDRFEIAFQNSGDVHTSLVGDIKIKNIFGKAIKEIGVGPWYIMPNSLKIKDVSWKNKKVMFGIYTAQLKLYENHSSEAKEKRIFIWAFPWQIVLIIFLIALLVFFLVRFIERHYRLIIKEKRAISKSKKRKNK